MRKPGSVTLAAGLIAIAVLAAYLNTLAAPFVFDDAPAIVENPSIRDLADWRAVLGPPASAGSAAGRPLVNLSFALNYAAGGLDPRGYHAVNIGLHAAAALLLFGIARRTLQRPPLAARHGPAATPLAFFAALLWAVHPLLTESVACVVQRTEILGGLGLMLALYGFIRHVEAGSGRRWGAVTVAACYAGVAAKEIVAVAPLLIAGYDALFVSGSWRETWVRRRRLLLVLAGSWGLLAGLVVLGKQRGGVAGFGLGVSAWDYLLTSCQAIGIYLRLSFWPHPLVLDYGTEVVRALGPVWPQFLLLTALGLLTCWGLVRRHAGAFAGLWFFLILGPSSSLLPLVSQPIAEHRMYLPLAAIILPVVLGAYRVLGRKASLLAFAAAAVLAVVTVSRNAQYESPVRIWTDTVAQRPGNSRAHSLLALALDRAGRTAEALAASREAARLAPQSPEMQYNLGYALLHAGQADEAVTAFAAALRLRPGYAEAHCNLGAAYLALRRGREAHAHLEAALRLRPAYADAHYNLGNLFAQTGRLSPAIASYRAALAAEPGRADAHFNLGKALLLAGDPTAAATHFERVLQLTPGDEDARRNLAEARARVGSPPAP